MSALKKSLDLKDLTLFGLSSILGSGGFNLIGKAVRAGSAAWPALFGTVATLLLGGAWSYTRAHQIAGTNTSETDVIHSVFGSLGENAAAIGIMLSSIVSIAVILVFVTELIFPSAHWGFQVFFSTVLLAAMAGFSLVGIDINKTAVNGFTWLLVVVLAAAMGLGGWGALKGLSPVDDMSLPTPRAATTSLMYFFFIMAGFDALMKFAQEAKAPESDMPTAFFGTNIIADVLVLGVSAALAMWVPGLTEKQEMNALGHLFARFMGPSAVGIMRLLMIIFMLVTTFVVFLATSRYLFSFGEKREGLKWLTELNASQVPWAAVAIVFVIGFIGLVINHIDVLVRVANGGFIVTLGLVAAAVSAIDFGDGPLWSAAVNALTAAGFGGLLTITVL